MKVRQLLPERAWCSKNEFCFGVNKDNSPCFDCFISDNGYRKHKKESILIGNTDTRTVYESNSDSATE